MGKKIPTSVSFNLPDGKEVTIETGKLATQAHGSVVVRIEDTMILATIVSAHEPREGAGFFPLSVDYQEKYASVGRIPGNFFRRETRLNDYEILISRLVDRAIRPLFPDGYMHDTQVILTLHSSDQRNLPDAYAALAASAAIVVSDINWNGPISEVRVAKIDGTYVVNPEKDALEGAELEIIVAATLDNVMMHKKATLREVVMSEKVRLDGRATDQVRPIWTEVDYLPSAHGSAIFNRGETQALASLTLGTKLDKKMEDTALAQTYEKFMLHYNFPALSVGEIKPMRGPGRREVGHANLAGRSLKKVLPEDSPYTIRIVSDILESNGSSSMATVCAGSLALMDAGINIKSPVSGIAMGMISDGTRNIILSDILGDEDALGDMDFKVTGTDKGITACQMDIKVDGLPYETLTAALEQAKAGRLRYCDQYRRSR